MTDYRCWLHNWSEPVGARETALAQVLAQHGVDAALVDDLAPRGPGLCIFREPAPELREFLRTVTRAGRERVIAIADRCDLPSEQFGWDLLQAGASDVLTWASPDRLARQVQSRFERWHAIEELLDDKTVTDLLVGPSQRWRQVLRGVIEIARFSDATALILGESGTGKEIVARLIHRLDPRPGKRDLVILDCSTVVPELSGSEFFGHERGAFTGASSERHGAFALANGGTLLLDEVGELPVHLQAQLLRVIQERTFKRVGGNTWHKTDFRLVCATNRDLPDMVHRGWFRPDLYYRIASYVCKLPPLRERIEDIIPLTEHFLRQARPNAELPALDTAVRHYLLGRSYPGNVRELRQVVSRLTHSYVGDGTITVGNVPIDDIPDDPSAKQVWRDLPFELLVRRALLLGAGLKEIGRAAEDAAIRIVTDEEDGNLQRAARRLGVTDRALQLRRANRSQYSRALESEPSQGQTRG